MRRHALPRHALPLLLAPALVVACASRPGTSNMETLADLERVRPNMQEARVPQGLDLAMQGYRSFLEEAPETEMTPEAIRRLADLQLEKQFGIRAGEGERQQLASPLFAEGPLDSPIDAPIAETSADGTLPLESDQDFEQRATAADGRLAYGEADGSIAGVDAEAGPLEAIALYDRLLTEYPSYEHNDQVLYQKARAYDELGRTEEAIATMERLIEANPYSDHLDEVQFRRGEFYFTRRHFRKAETAYEAIITLGTDSSYHELALYKLGWTLYKQEFYEEALHRYMELLDHKVSIGYDFDQTYEEDDERRVTDTFRVISLSFSNFGGPETVPEYFAEFGTRSYEDRVYKTLGAHFLAKLRYDDAAKTYKAFVELYPLHREAPHFSMRVVDTFTEGGFPKLVLEAKREFASKYGLQADYWRQFTPEERPEVLAYLKANLKDLATHYHAQYQSTEDENEKLASYGEALQWYGDYLESFPTDADSPPINYQFAELLLEHEDFGAAAKQYERTAYEYPPHEQSAAAGYAAVYAYRQQLDTAGEMVKDVVRQETVASSLRFADEFPDHEHAAAVLGAAADDLYEMNSYEPAIESARRVIDDYPDAEIAIRRAAWIVVAHGSFDLEEYPQAEDAYTEVLAATPEDDESHAALVDNLAASIYKQGEIANEAEDYREAADHFLRIRAAAPTSTIRPTAEYDAGAALMELEDWTAAAGVLEEFRNGFPEHELHDEATRLIAHAYREDGQLSRAADEFDLLASQSEDPAVRSEAMLVAGDLYEQAENSERALDVYERFVAEFPTPVEPALEARFKIAGIYKANLDDALYHQELTEIVRIDAEAGPERTARTRTLASRSALVLAEQVFTGFVAVKLSQPFDVSLAEKKQRMDSTIAAMGDLVAYEISDVTAAATYYMAETYFDFSQSLMESERPADLQPADMGEYELVLEEEAYPFEEKAIDVHRKNLEMMQAGVFNEWTEKSMNKLALLVPGRYAKKEMNSDLAGSIDSYEYRTPASQFYGPLPMETDEPQGNEQPENEPQVEYEYPQ